MPKRVLNNTTARWVIVLAILLFAVLWVFHTLHASHIRGKKNLDGLVGWWPADGNAKDVVTGTSGILENQAGFAAGVSGKAFNFLSSGASTLHTFVLFGWRFQFSRATPSVASGFMHVRIADRPELHLTNAMTLSAWVYPTQGGSYGSILCKWSAVSAPHLEESYGMAIYPDGRVYADATPAGGNNELDNVSMSKSKVPLNTWTHVAATYDGVSLNIYVNGRLENSLPYNKGIYAGSYDLGIGGLVGNAPPGMCASPFFGRIDDVCIYNRALTAAEIQADFEERKK